MTQNWDTSRKCPKCGGIGRLVVVHSKNHNMIGKDFPCQTCRGSGRVSDEHYKRILRGDELRAKRLSKNCGLREAAERIGVTPSMLSYAEQGQNDPEPYFEMIERLPPAAAGERAEP
jgi:hypothetical protein